jgi:hypothetical protein
MILSASLTLDLTCSFQGNEMACLAISYSALGRHQDALVLQEKTLEFLRRVLPENHPGIGVIRLCLFLCLYHLI